jgi:hypothetical protein
VRDHQRIRPLEFTGQRAVGKGLEPVLHARKLRVWPAPRGLRGSSPAGAFAHRVVGRAAVAFGLTTPLRRSQLPFRCGKPSLATTPSPRPLSADIRGLFETNIRSIAYMLPRMHLPRRRLNKGIRKGRNSESSGPLMKC